MLRTMLAWLKSHVTSERGQDLIEYAILGGLIGAALLAAAFVAGLSGALNDMATGIGDCIDFDSTTDCP